MGNLIQKAFCCKAPILESKVLILGLDNAGKTTLLYKIAKNDHVDTVPTIGYNMEEYRYKNITFLMWDIGGQSGMRPAWNSYFPAAKAVIFVIDSTDVERLPEIRGEFEKVTANEDLKDAAFLIFANKQDQSNALTPTEIEKRLGIPTILTHSIRVQPCSAVSGNGLEEGMDWITAVIR